MFLACLGFKGLLSSYLSQISLITGPQMFCVMNVFERNIMRVCYCLRQRETFTKLALSPLNFHLYFFRDFYSFSEFDF